MANPAWELRAAYMRTLSELKLECDREANAAQVGDIHDGELFAKIERVKAARATLVAACSAPAPVVPLLPKDAHKPPTVGYKSP